VFSEDFINPERISCRDPASSKKRALQSLGELLSQAAPELGPDEAFDKLLERERLGSTGLGHGIALPHARVAGVDKAYGAFIQLEESVDFDAIDNQPVDLIFGLLVPESATKEHLQLLAHLASMFSHAGFCEALRRATQPEEVMQQIEHWKNIENSA
jgi:PTS system nitrogen regulatory IIA component